MYKVEPESIDIYNYKVYREGKASFTQPIARTLSRKGAIILRDGFNERLQAIDQCQT